tara:strand:+ start:5595 stop:5900 length:306 start_codon:yes stop_codon:yes gene_type:complete
MKLKPVNDKIVVRPTKIENEHRTESGLILPDTAQDGGLLEGEVLAAGHGMYSTNGTLIPIVVEVGDTILYGKHNGGQEYRLNGEDVLLMSQNEVLSIVEEK